MTTAKEAAQGVIDILEATNDIDRAARYLRLWRDEDEDKDPLDVLSGLGDSVDNDTPEGGGSIRG